MTIIKEAQNEIANEIDPHDLARVEKCGLDMHEATEGKISVSSIKREVLGIRSPALIEQDKAKSAERG